MNSTVTTYEYQVSESQCRIEGRAYTVYGMAVYQQTSDPDSLIAVRTVPNISLSKTRVSDLVDRCNRLQPSLGHLDDIIEDFLP
jgi:hypothetical protein